MLAERGSEDAEVDMRVVRAEGSGALVEVDFVDVILSFSFFLSNLRFVVSFFLDLSMLSFFRPFAPLLRLWNAECEIGASRLRFKDRLQLL